MLQKLRKWLKPESVAKAVKFEHIPAPTRFGYKSTKYGQDPFGSKSRKADDPSTARQRQGADADDDDSLYSLHGLIEPPFLFSDCWTDYEQGDVLAECIDAVMKNVERPHDIEWVGEDIEGEKSDQEQANKRKLVDFCKRVNEKQSLLDLRKRLRTDREVTGNAFVEIIRNIKYEIERLYYIPSTYIRCTDYDETQVPVTVRMPRDGNLIEVTVMRRFRKFGRLISTNGQLKWFREFGDPRQLNVRTGEWTKDSAGRFLCDNRRILDPKSGQYVKNAAGGYTLHNNLLSNKDRATELWWFKDAWGGETYGIARWIPVLLEVRARYLAQWLNNDLLSNGGVPKGIILFQNGQISSETQKHIRETLQEWGDPRKFNQWVTINIEPDVFSMDLGTGSSKGASAKPEFINLDRNEDYMFKEYLNHCEEAIRKIYRLSPVFVGGTSEYTHATAYAAQEAAETQVFGPMRDEFDEKFTVELIQGEFGMFNWRIKTKRARIGDEETFYRAVGMWSRAGLSWNQMVQLGNEMLGTHFVQRPGPIWDMPWDSVKSLIATGNYTIEGNDLVRVLPSVIEDHIVPQIDTPDGGQSTKSASNLPDTIDDAVTLQRVLTRLNQKAREQYEPPVITDNDRAI